MNENAFELFGLPQTYRVSKTVLRERLQSLQRAVHPDRHAADDPVSRLQAANLSARINETYRQLSDPVRRAELLAEIRGIHLPSADSTYHDPELLMEQMSAREHLEQIEESGDETALDIFYKNTLSKANEVEEALADLFEQSALDVDALHQLLTRLRFLQKLKGECARIEAAFEDAGG